jgi:hypothetical protein
VRKIISILIALGLVLGLSVMATPVSANVTTPAVSLTSYCACTAANYTIVFNITASLTEGVHSVTVAFPAGTTVPASFATGDITIKGDSVFGSEVTVSGTTVTFLVPADYVVGDNPITVVFGKLKIKNPCVAGPYNLYVNTSRAPDSTPVKSATYTIVPATSTYGWLLDFSPTYPGIEPSFVPPFKACGQNMTTTTYNASIGGFLEPFTLTLKPTVVGCLGPCATNVTLALNVTALPSATAKVTLQLGSTWYTLTEAASAVDLGIAALGFNTTVNWASLIHFSEVGTYTICLDAVCPAGAPVCPSCSSEAVTVAHRCVDFKVHQWKDAAKITLQEKWNLISLPLVPLEDPPIADLLASIKTADLAKILSIWHYDRCSDTWATWGNGQSSLTELVDGAAYWVRVAYPLAACGNITWWVWGTEKPMPPASPAEYEVCDGWNMVGFLGTAPSTPAAYLWNWAGNMPVVYGWTQGCWTAQGWSIASSLVPGQGYWMAFDGNGAVYVP